MARRFNKRAAEKKVKSKHASKDDKKSSKKGGEKKKPGAGVVAKYMYFAKHTLAPYPDEDGSALYVGDHEDEGALLDPAAVLRTRNSNNCEMLRRPGMGLSLSAASIDVGLKALKKPSALKKLKTALATDEGEALRKACKTLNIGKNGKAKRSQVQEAVKAYAKQMSQSDRPGVPRRVGGSGFPEQQDLHRRHGHLGAQSAVSEEESVGEEDAQRREAARHDESMDEGAWFRR